MKYHITPELEDAIGGIDLIGSTVPTFSEISSEYYPPAIIAEVCQTVGDNNTLINNQKNIKYVISKKFRPYSLPIPNLVPISKIEKYQLIYTTNSAKITLDNLEIGNSVKKLNNVHVNAINSLLIDTISPAVISSIYVNTLNSKNFSSEIGIINNVNGTNLEYTNAQISSIVSNSEFHIDTLNCAGLLTVVGEISAHNLNLGSYYFDSKYTADDEYSASHTTVANLNNIATSYNKYGSSNSYDAAYSNKFGLVVSLSGSGNIVSNRNIVITAAVNNNNILGVIDKGDPPSTLVLGTNGVLNDWDHRDISNHLVFPIVPFGIGYLRTTDTNIKKFDRLSLNTNGTVKKYSSGNTKIGIALEEPTNNFVKCVILT